MSLPLTPHPHLVDELLTDQTYTVRELDFREVEDIFLHRDARRRNHSKPPVVDIAGHLLKPARIKDRQKRLAKRIEREEMNTIGRPVEDWDIEELAKGRPRNAIGTFTGAPPAYVTRGVYEAAMDRFKGLIRSDMQNHTIKAIETLGLLLGSEETDDNGKPIVAASTKLDAAKFLIEHLLGKPVQRQETDISVKLQGIMSTVMINPNVRTGALQLAHLPGVTMPLLEASTEDDEDIIDAELEG